MAIHQHKHDVPPHVQFAGDIALDTECTGLNFERDRLCVVQISDGQDDAHLIVLDRNYEAPRLRALLSDPNRVKIMHYARFDMAAVLKHLGIVMQNVYCTKIASRFARTYSEGHSLKDLCREFLGLNLSKEQQCSYWGADKLSDAQLKYAAGDVLYLHQLRHYLDRIIDREGRRALVEQCFAFLPTRVQMDLSGYTFDVFGFESKRQS